MPASSTTSRSPRRSRALTSGAESTRRHRPSSSQRKPCWWSSQAAEYDAAPIAPSATWAALRVGVTTTIRRPAAIARSRVAASRAVLPAPAAPSITVIVLASARVARRSTISCSTASTSTDVNERTCSGTSDRGSSGREEAMTRAVRSSANSRRTAPSTTPPPDAMIRSTSPRASAAFHADWRDPSLTSASSTTPSRSTAPVRKVPTGAPRVGAT